MSNQPSGAFAVPRRSCSLFVLDHGAVRLVHVTHATGAAILTVHGPGAATAVYTCESEWECLDKQRALESTLGASGYTRHDTDERRANPDRRRFPRGDRRRPSTYR